MKKGDPSRRRYINELETFYLTNPTLHDVIVEGRTDAKIVRWYLAGLRARREITVYAVDDRVEVSAGEVLAVPKAEVGPRGRILALASSARDWGAAKERLTCIVDLDRDWISANRLTSPVLARTDFGSIDVYTFHARPLQQFLTVTAGINIDASELIAELLPPLNSLFALRTALHELNIKMIPFGSYVTSNRLSTTIQIEELAKRSLDDAAAEDEYLALLDRVENIIDIVPKERLLAVRGHDIAPLLIQRLKLRNELARVNWVETSLQTCLSATDLDSFPLFRWIQERLDLGPRND